MRENRTYGSEGGEPSNGSLPYPYQGQGTALVQVWGKRRQNYPTLAVFIFRFIPRGTRMEFLVLAKVISQPDPGSLVSKTCRNVFWKGA